MRRGALLLETLLALAIFTTAAGFTIMAIRDGSASAERATLKSRAVDMAASQLASIEAGIIPLVSGPVEDSEFGEEEPELWMDVATSPAAFPGLTQVEILVFFDDGNQMADDASPLARVVSLLPSGGTE